MAKIEQIGRQEGTNGAFYKVVIDGKTYRAFGDSEAFDKLENKEVKLNDSVEFDFATAEGNYKGKQVTYKNLTSIEKSNKPAESQAKSEEQVKSEEHSSYDQTNKKIIRMNSLQRALEYVELNKEAILEALNKEGGTDKLISTGTVLKIAEGFENWVNRTG